MKDKNTVEIGVKATGFEEAAEQMELMADAMNEFPATVNIKAKECEISFHATNYIEMAEPEPSWAKGGVRLEPDLDEESAPEEDEIVLPKGTIKEMIITDFLKEVKKMCSEQSGCDNCFLYEAEGNVCKVRGLFPDNWRI